MKFLQIALGAVLLALACASPSFAQLNVRDANGLVQRTCDVVDTTGWVHPCNVMEAIYGGQPIQLSAETDHSLDVTIKASPGLTAAQLTAANLALHSDMLVIENLLTPLLQGGGYIGNPNFLEDCMVVAGDQAWTAGTQQHCTMTPTGRIRVGLSSAATVGQTASTTADLAGAIDSSGNQQGLHLDGSYDLKTVDMNSAAALTAAQTVATAQGAAGTGITPPTGGFGVLGYLSGIYNKSFGIGTTGTPNIIGGSANAPLTQGTGAAGANSQNVFIGGAYSGINFGANMQLSGNAVPAISSASASSPTNVPSVGTLGNLSYAESTTALGASSVFTGSSHATPVWATYFNVTFWADQASATNGAEIDCSLDNTTFRTMPATTLAASTMSIISVPASCPYYRVKLANGTTAQGNLQISSSYTGG
jgi:hypothetical protein